MKTTDDSLRACENCRFWDNSSRLADDKDDVTGVCRVNPPVADDRSGRARWPYTEDTDWCGKWEETA